ncbi:hypothetical protein NliqN6_2162 [Naganishia liquefaciens]|uniref:Calcium/proton exchanger n=1 Tax=Naganishia liquefaciens TaxID=104408 RepID=A0A8H3TRA6_9TREE|nr:hypothetical protein NliqN6_2162 [Naganishia liquefaciens]
MSTSGQGQPGQKYNQKSEEDTMSPTGTIRRIPSSEISEASIGREASITPGMDASEYAEPGDRAEKLYSHVVKAGSTPARAADSANLSLRPPMTPSASSYQRQQQYLTAPPSASSTRISRSTSRSRPMPAFIPGLGSRQPSSVAGGMKTSRSVSRARRLEGVASARGEEDYSDDDMEYAFVKHQPQTAHRPMFGKSFTSAGPLRYEQDKRNKDGVDEDDDEPLGQDDEVVVRDRGEDLIRKRMRERKKAKRLANASAHAAAREARARDFANPSTPSNSSPNVVQNDASFQSYQPDDARFGTSLSSAPPTPALNPNERQSNVHRGKSTSRARTPVPARATASTPGIGDGSSEATGSEYFPSYGDNRQIGASSTDDSLPQEEDESLSHEAERASTPTAREPHIPTMPSSGSFSAVDWAYLDRREYGRIPRQQQRQHTYSHQASRNQSRAPSVMSEVISDVVRGAGSASQQISEEGESDDDNDDRVEEDRDEEQDEEDDDDGDGDDDEDDEGVTMRDRQDAINIEHPFGLPIWKPALYKKSRSITRNAEKAMHAIPSAAAERHLLPGNILWTILFGWWLALLCFALAILVFAVEFVSSGGQVKMGVKGEVAYARTIAGLGWYLGWPFGKYVEGKGVLRPGKDEEGNSDAKDSATEEEAGSQGINTATAPDSHQSAISTDSSRTIKVPNGLEINPQNGERQGLMDKRSRSEHAQAQGVTFGGAADGEARRRLYGAIDTSRHAHGGSFRHKRGTLFSRLMGGAAYWIVFLGVVAPILGSICLICWGMVITIPMAKLTWNLLKYLTFRPLEIKFRSAPAVIAVVGTGPTNTSTADAADQQEESSSSTFRPARLKAGQLAPTSGPDSTVLLCIYRAIGLQYYKYTIGGVNIIFVNLLPLVFFTIFDGMVLLPAVERAEHRGEPINPLLALIASQALIFILSLASVIPLSYFIGMAVASISAQSSIGMGAVINATFGSIIEIVLYGIALTQGKGKLVEGSIVGSLLAGVLLMPGASMISGAFKRKEQKFNAKSAGVTSTMLIMAIIGTLTPTLFYQTYGSFQLKCDGCPDNPPIEVHDTLTSHGHNQSWNCERCYYVHPEPAQDPFYQDQVKGLMYICAVILVLAYLIGLWFSLRTHASQIWQNPQPLMRLDEIPAGGMHPAHRATVYQRLTPQAVMQQLLPTTAKATEPTSGKAPEMSRRPTAGTEQVRSPVRPDRTASRAGIDREAMAQKQKVSAPSPSRTPYNRTPRMAAGPSHDKLNDVTNLQLPNGINTEGLTTEEFTRAVAVATVNALKNHENAIAREWKQARAPLPFPEGGHPPPGAGAAEHSEGHGGHEGPSWSRVVSAGVLLGCTILYAIIAEILVDVVDVVLQGSGIDEKFLGVSLFALVPNTTEFMNAMSFALSGNIALSMEIGSAYALQVCLLQIPAMVAFSAIYDPGKMGEMVDTFTLIFPRWDVISIVLSIFLLTYTYIEARSNYHRGSILVLSYLVLAAGFYFAPGTSSEDTSPDAFGVMGYAHVVDTSPSFPRIS